MSSLPPTNRVPENILTAIIPVSGYKVGSWCPKPNGQGSAEQVHFQLIIENFDYPLVLRLKSREACETLIASLQRHMNDVWP